MITKEEILEKKIVNKTIVLNNSIYSSKLSFI